MKRLLSLTFSFFFFITFALAQSQPQLDSRLATSPPAKAARG